MRYPTMRVKTEKVLANAKKVMEICSPKGIEVWGVTKGLAGNPGLAAIYADAGFHGIADSRLRNLRKIRDAGNALSRQLIRIAMPSELEELPGVADASLQSEVSTIRRLDEICAAAGLTHNVLLAVDVGDLREGFWPKELPDLRKTLGDLKGGVKIAGIAANFACASGVLPTIEKMYDLVIHRDTLQDALGYNLPTISVGGTCCLKVIAEERDLPHDINQLRICEGVLLGRDTAFMRDIPGFHQDAVSISAEVLECRFKPSVPNGELGFQAFGEKPIFVDRGMRKRALLGIGRQDVNIDKLFPLEKGIQILTASSDHMVVDVSEAEPTIPKETAYKPGDVLSFGVLYPAMLAAATSEYVEVCFE